MIEPLDSLYASCINTAANTYADRLSGSLNAQGLIAYTQTLSQEVLDALHKSAHALGLFPDYLFFQVAGLEEGQVLEALEGLDPVFVIAADKAASTLLALSYNQKFTQDCATRLQGRNAVLLQDIERSVIDPHKKPVLWQLLKTLPAL